MRGHVPLSVCVIINDDATRPQLSDAVPPPARNVLSVVNAGGMLLEQTPFTAGGQVMVGLTVSSMVIVCMQLDILPQESCMEYVRVITRGQVPLVVWEKVNVD